MSSTSMFDIITSLNNNDARRPQTIYLGAEIHYAVTDCVALVREVANHQVPSLIKTRFRIRAFYIKKD